jgi:hypothetical protein
MLVSVLECTHWVCCSKSSLHIANEGFDIQPRRKNIYNWKQMKPLKYTIETIKPDFSTGSWGRSSQLFTFYTHFYTLNNSILFNISKSNFEPCPVVRFTYSSCVCDISLSISSWHPPTKTPDHSYHNLKTCYSHSLLQLRKQPHYSSSCSGYPWLFGHPWLVPPLCSIFYLILLSKYKIYFAS